MITAEQRAARADKIGSSDAAAILGLDPNKNRADVYLEKTGEAAPFAGNENTDRGNLLEPVLVKWAEQELGLESIRDVMFTHPSGLLVANLDGCLGINRANEVTAIIEAKSATDPDAWGEPGTDEVPDRVLVQVAHQFVCVPSARVCWIPVLLPAYHRFDFRLYRVERNDALCATVEQRGIDFMNRYVKPRVMPPAVTPSLEVLKRVRRLPGLVVDVPDELVGKYEMKRRCRLTAEKEEAAAQAELIAALGQAEGGIYSGGMVTYQLVKRKAEEKPRPACEYRTLKVKPNKQEKAAAPAKEPREARNQYALTSAGLPIPDDVADHICVGKPPF